MEEEEALARRAGEGREAEDQVDQVDQAQAQADRVVGLLAAADTADTTIEGIGEVSSFSFGTIVWLEAFVVFFSPFALPAYLAWCWCTVVWFLSFCHVVGEEEK